MGHDETGGITVGDRLHRIEDSLRDQRADLGEHIKADEVALKELGDKLQEFQIKLAENTTRLAIFIGIIALIGNWLIKKFG